MLKGKCLRIFQGWGEIEALLDFNWTIAYWNINADSVKRFLAEPNDCEQPE